MEVENAPLEGYRLFDWAKMNNGVLRGKHSALWTSPKFEATCEVGNCEEHLRAGICSCGIYVVKDRGNHDYWLSAASKRAVEFEAKMKMWGVCVEATMGTRCQFAEIETLTLIVKACINCGYPGEWLFQELSLCDECYKHPDASLYFVNYSSLTRWYEIIEQVRNVYPDTPVDVQPLMADFLQGQDIPFPVPPDFVKQAIPREYQSIYLSTPRQEIERNMRSLMSLPPPQILPASLPSPSYGYHGPEEKKGWFQTVVEKIFGGG